MTPKLAAEWGAGMCDVEQRIVEYMPSARYLARRMWLKLGGHVELDELQSEAYLAVVAADKRWKPELGAYTTFMRHRVRGALIDYLRSLDMLSRTERKRVGNSFGAVQQFDDEGDDESGANKLSMLRTHDMSALDRVIVSEWLDRPANRRDREILRLCLLEGHTQAVVAEVFGLTGVRIHQIVRAACSEG